MADGDATFGCGTYLPGGGPGNFDEFEGGGTIDGGEGFGGGWIDTDQGGGGPPTGPPGVLDGGGGGGGGNSWGHGDPIKGVGGGTLYNPSDETACRCRITTAPTGPVCGPITGPGGGKQCTVTFKQKCQTKAKSEGGNSSQDTITAYIENSIPAQAVNVKVTGPTNGIECGDKIKATCKDDTATCGDIIITYKLPFTVGGEDQPTGPGGPLQSNNAGGGLVGFGKTVGGFGGNVSKSLLSTAQSTKEFDLNDPTITSLILKQKPAGIQDPDVAFLLAPPTPSLVKNNSRITELFNDNIDSNVEYILANQRNSGNWDSTRASGVTYTSVYRSLKPEIKNLLRQIRNYDGTPLTTNQIFSMIGSRIIDGTISKVTKSSLLGLAKSSKKRDPVVITRSNSTKVNEVVALSLVDRDKFTLDPAKAEGRMKNILPNWKTLSSDIDRYIEITVGGEIKKYYIKDDNTFISRSSLALSDGDYFDITRGSTTLRLVAKSEIDHAYLIPEQTRQQVISLLGGTTGRTLEVSSNILSGVEFDYSLSTPRQDFYMLSCVLSSIDTKPNPVGSFLLKESVARYELIDTTTTDSLKTCNDFIKYKANHRVFILDDEDVMLDYIQSTSSLTVKQTDILADSPKANKTIPLLTRQIPWYIMVYPTNRSSLNIFNSKSSVITLESSGPVVRQLKCNTSIVPNFSLSHTDKFIRYHFQGLSGMDVYGKTNLQTRITKVTSSDTVFKTGYEQNDQLVSAEEYTPSRRKTGLRLLKEIITELDTNYLLGLDGIGKSLTEFDVFSRLTLKQFNILSRLDNFGTIRDSIRNGLFEEVKIIPPINRANSRISFQKTQLVRRKVRVEDDIFPSIKGTKDNQIIIPPTLTGPATFGPVKR